MSHHTKLDENLEGADKFRAWKYRISLVLQDNEFDSYIHVEVPVPEGDDNFETGSIGSPWSWKKMS